MSNEKDPKDTLTVRWAKSLEGSPGYCPIHGKAWKDDPSNLRMVCSEGHEVRYPELMVLFSHRSIIASVEKRLVKAHDRIKELSNEQSHS